MIHQLIHCVTPLNTLLISFYIFKSFRNQTRNSKQSAKAKRPENKNSEIVELKDELTKKNSELG